MSKFSKTLFLFTIYPIVHFTFITLVNRQLSLPSNLPLSESKTLIIGDSHTQKGLNPKLFDDAINLSQSAEPMVISYWKLKFVFDAIQPNTVIIGFGRHKISSNQDRVFYDKRTSHEFFRRRTCVSSADLHRRPLRRSSPCRYAYSVLCTHNNKLKSESTKQPVNLS